MNKYIAVAMALYYLSIIGYFSDYSKNEYGNPWPSVKRIVENISIKIIYIIKKIFKRKTTKSLINPVRFKSWKGER